MENNLNIDCILLIDDDDITNFLNEEMLYDLNISESVASINTVEEAFIYLDDCFSPIDQPKKLLIILDLVMPGMDGFSFLDELNAQYQKTSQKIDIIILTNSLDGVDKEKAEKYNVLDFISKPLNPEKIKKALKKIKSNHNIEQ